MELNEFVKETLLQLINGVKSAQEEAENVDAVINPAEVFGLNNILKASIKDKQRLVQLIEFEVGLTSCESESSKKGIGVMLGGVGVGGNTSKGGNLSTVTNIKFSVPIVLPSTDNENTPYTPKPHINTNRNVY